jgi:2-polyprenyl-6-methoxyphenol hydroxylase-like FAD-dependent oxidoreductase
MRVGIVGGGIGGLTLALQLHQRGIECEIWEAASELKPLGVGINLLPHAVRELSSIGLQARLADIAIETSTLSYFNQFGQPIWSEARGRAAGYDWPQFSIHRGEFQMLLAEVTQERLGSACLQTGLRAEGFTPVDQGVMVHLKQRSANGGDETLIHKTVDIVVASDGIHSAIRRQLYPPERDPLRFAGRMLWRAVTESEPYLDGRTMFMAGHQDQKFVAYPISEPLRRRGRSLINWIAELRVSPESLQDDWNREVPKATFDQAFASWKWPWINIPDLIERAEVVYEFPLVDKDPLPRWTAGRLTLLGDAAHPMYPIGSNGSAQAILDAGCLADALEQAQLGHMSPEMALLEYEADRLAKTTGIVLKNRLNGPEQVMQMAHERAPQGFADVHEVITHQELEAVSQRYKRVAGFDKQSVGKASSR